ncbi:hypothetical protein J2W88_003965 [Acidovorax delafieldii]|uniref:DUF551 domain-containing protein n=1 Tax=Acidovorax delafieldii TaxID=47920 RepID=A0AAJ2F2G1_ACIDE|nr:hypothetical protein [Acidovorax delafieldii]MDR6768661.1 hypothetical protein [Acidovorax delafieldii]MDR6837377.1 hypothetical protein [Acidovorax delafieldii]MDR7366867.1 hypothetical protein [Acidovorax delafieldii]
MTNTDMTNTDMSKEREAYSCCNTWFASLPEGRKAVLRHDKWMLAHAAFEAGRASLSANAGEPPRDGWLHENGLLYRLTDERHPCNRDEINVTMADGSRSVEARSRRALELLDRIRAAPPTAQAEGWRPIETAPKDGLVDILNAGRRYAGCHYDRICGEYRHITACGVLIRLKSATHWMPLPPPPTSAEGVEHG